MQIFITIFTFSKTALKLVCSFRACFTISAQSFGQNIHFAYIFWTKYSFCLGCMKKASNEERPLKSKQQKLADQGEAICIQ